ncbi:MAG: PaaI family thioesterase [Candidatus Hydrogenedentota bacterium]
MAVTDKLFEGFTRWEGCDPFEDHVGPLYYRDEPDGSCRCAFVTDDYHMNGSGNMHGGMLMTFADYAMFFFARKHIGDAHAVTVSFHADFTSASQVGEYVEATGEVIHETRKMLFVRGQITSGGRMLLNFSGVLKKVAARGE